ncbi:hypothetical protein NR798_16410 [Archangium gephyra]|uniref:hypothetical protein n=1 Tax=Archangium gephyra TaxID=48 RepID=UPI0035D4A5FD
MMSSKRSLLPLSLLVLAIASLATGCAASRREAYVQEKASQYVYRKPIADVWPHVQTLLKEKELELREAPGAYEISTDWQMAGAPSSLGTAYARYLVRGKQPTAATCSVQIFKQNRVETAQSQGSRTNQGQENPGFNDSTNLQRDMEMEWELLQRVDPEAAKSLRAEAETNIK